MPVSVSRGRTAMQIGSEDIIEPRVLMYITEYTQIVFESMISPTGTPVSACHSKLRATEEFFPL